MIYLRENFTEFNSYYKQRLNVAFLGFKYMLVIIFFKKNPTGFKVTYNLAFGLLFYEQDSQR